MWVELEENGRCSDDEEGNEEHKFTRFFLSHKFLRPICSADCGSFTSRESLMNFYFLFNISRSTSSSKSGDDEKFTTFFSAFSFTFLFALCAVCGWRAQRTRWRGEQHWRARPLTTILQPLMTTTVINPHTIHRTFCFVVLLLPFFSSLLLLLFQIARKFHTLFSDIADFLPEFSNLNSHENWHTFHIKEGEVKLKILKSLHGA